MTIARMRKGWCVVSSTGVVVTKFFGTMEDALVALYKLVEE